MSTDTDQKPRNVRRNLTGVVVSDRMEKSISVRVERRFKHPKYGKYLRRHETYMAHDEEQQAKPGDIVEIASCRPMSKRKRWRLAKVLVVSNAVEGSAAEEARPQEILQTAAPEQPAPDASGGDEGGADA